jgi:hypothetical protein
MEHQQRAYLISFALKISTRLLEMVLQPQKALLLFLITIHDEVCNADACYS